MMSLTAIPGHRQVALKPVAFQPSSADIMLGGQLRRSLMSHKFCRVGQAAASMFMLCQGC